MSVKLGRIIKALGFKAFLDFFMTENGGLEVSVAPSESSWQFSIAFDSMIKPKSGWVDRNPLVKG